MNKHGGENIRNNSVQLNERNNFNQRQPKHICQWESELSCWDSSNVVIVVVSQGLCRGSYRLMDFDRAVREAPHQRLFANTRCTNVRVRVTELLSMCSGGSETYRANVAVSSEAGRRFATVAWLRFLFGLDPVIFPCNECEEITEIRFLC